MDLSELSDQALVANATALVSSHRELTAKLVAYLAEIEERRLHLIAGYSSMFDFCQQKLGMSEGEAFRRILAARLSRRFPAIVSLLASGAVNLSTLELVRDYLSEDNHEGLLADVAKKSKREVMKILAARFPRPDRPSRIQRMACLELLSEGRFRVEFTASEKLCNELERCRDLMSHANPSRELAVVIERAVHLLLADLERKRLGRSQAPMSEERRRASRPRPSESVQNEGRGERMRNEGHGERVRNDGHGKGVRHGTPPFRITTAVKREVFRRDGARCSYVADDGRRCDARAFLELDHIDPKGRGGSNDAANLRVRCRAHNRLWAEQTYGRERVERARHFCQKKSSPSPSNEQTTEPAYRNLGTPSELGAPARVAVFEKVQSALRGMGFRCDEARQAVAAVAMTHEADERLVVEDVLREAILVATAA